MKKIRVLNKTTDVVVITDYKYINQIDVPELELKAGDDIRGFYHRNKGKYDFVPMNYYDKPYTQEDKLEVFRKKNPMLDKWIEEFDLELT